MTKNLRRCLRFFSYILEQRETDIIDDLEETLFIESGCKNHSFYVQFSHSPLQNELTHGMIVLC